MVQPRQVDVLTDELAQATEWARCAASPLYFIGAYGWVFNATEQAWLPFALWPAQAWVVVMLLRYRLVVMCKARQLGMTWLVLGYVLWLMIFRPGTVVGIFSRTETDAGELLDFRLKGMYALLPEWMRCAAVLTDNVYRWELSNGSIAMAFPTTGGRQHTFSFILADEADFQPDLAALLRAVKPAIDAGGRMVMLSTIDKRRPLSLFKTIYAAGKVKANQWLAIFLPWSARPDRTPDWYAGVMGDVLANTGVLDDLHQEYPATDVEALAPRSADKRIPSAWLQLCYVEVKPLAVLPEASPTLPQLAVFVTPAAGHTYVLGVDPAEGNPTSDDSAICVLDVETGEECAALVGKFQPAVLAAYAAQLSTWYNGAGMMVGRNNHGHAVLGWLRDNVRQRQRILKGQDKREGWVETTLGKVLLYDALTESFKARMMLLHEMATYLQVANIEGSSLRAPAGQADDRADAVALANMARRVASQVSTGGY